MIPIIIRTKSSTYKHNLPYKQRQQKAVSQPFTILPSLQSRPGDTRSLPPSMVRQCTTDLGNMIVSTCPAAPPEVADCNQAIPTKAKILYQYKTEIFWHLLSVTIMQSDTAWFEGSAPHHTIIPTWSDCQLSSFTMLHSHMWTPCKQKKIGWYYMIVQYP